MSGSGPYAPTDRRQEWHPRTLFERQPRKAAQSSCAHHIPMSWAALRGFVLINALGSRNVSGRISREQTSERIVAVWGKRPEVVARLPIQIVNDKGRYRQDSVTGAPRTLKSLYLAPE